MSVLGLIRDGRRAMKQGPAAIALRQRSRFASGSDADCIWQSLSVALDRLLADHELSHVQVERAAEPPEQSRSGKFRQVIPLKAKDARR